MGTSKKVTVDIAEYKLPKEFKFLICSDGLYDGLRDEEIREVVYENKTSKMVDELVEASLLQGSKDNISVIYIAQGEENESK